MLHWWSSLSFGQQIGVATFAATLVLALSTVLHQHGKLLRSAAVISCKHIARQVSRVVRFAFTWMKKRFERLYWFICSRNRRTVLALERGHLTFFMDLMVDETSRQRTEALLVGHDETEYDQISRRRIVAAMHARADAFKDAIAIINGERVPDVKKTSAEWRYVQGGNTAYGCLERADKRWRFNRNVYFSIERTIPVKHLRDRYLDFAKIEYRAVLRANGKVYKGLSGILGGVESDTFQMVAVERFCYHNYGKASAYAAMLKYLGEEIPSGTEKTRAVRCRIYRNNKNQVVVLTDEDIETLFPNLASIEGLNMSEHGLEEYVSGSLSESDYHW